MNVPSPAELLQDQFDPATDYRLVLPSGLPARLRDGFSVIQDVTGPLGEHFVLVGRPLA